MHFSSILSLSLSLLLTPVLSSPTPVELSRRGGEQLPTYNNNTIFQSPANYTTPGTLYARTIQLADSSLLATWENYSPEPPLVYFPIYRSTDYGVTWTEISRVTDQVLNYGLRYQPFLYVLPTDWAGFDKGTILLSGSAIPTDLSSTHIELYASRDQGHTWTFVSHVAAGGEAIPNNGLTPIWEPFLLLHNGQLICYYSDQRDPLHGQKLVHQITTDGLTWGPVVDDVAYSNYTQRPGMFTVAQLKDGNWIATYEYGGGPVDGVLPINYTFPVYYKISDDPTSFDDKEGLPIVTDDAARVVPAGSPYVVVTTEGTVIVSCGTESDVYVQRANATGGVNVDGWRSQYTGERISYTRSLRLITAKGMHGRSGEQKLLLAGGGPLPATEMNKVTVGLVGIEGW